MDYPYCRIRCGVVGLGRSGVNHHLQSFQALSDRFKIAGVYDPDEAQAGRIAAEFATRKFSTLETMLHSPDIDLVVIATPSWLHAPQCLEAIRAGKHVICEKPMATTLADAREVVDAAKDAGVIFSVFHNSRFSPDFLKIREIIASGVLGDLMQVRICMNNFVRRQDWQGFLEFGGGVLFNMGPHAIDQGVQFLPEGKFRLIGTKREAFSRGRSEDHVQLLMLPDTGGPLVNIELSNSDAFNAPRWHIIGNRGGLKGTALKFSWKWLGTKPLVPLKEAPVSFRASPPESLHWEEENWCDDADTRDIGYYSAFHEAFFTRREPLVPEAEALLVMEIIQGIHDAPSLQAVPLYRPAPAPVPVLNPS